MREANVTDASSTTNDTSEQPSTNTAHTSPNLTTSRPVSGTTSTASHSNESTTTPSSKITQPRYTTVPTSPSKRPISTIQTDSTTGRKEAKTSKSFILRAVKYYHNYLYSFNFGSRQT